MHSATMAVRPDPTKDDALAVAAAQGTSAVTTTNNRDSAPAATAAVKRLATAAARCARFGIQLHTIDGDFGHAVHIATLHALTKSFDDLDQVDAWLEKIGAPG